MGIFPTGFTKSVQLNATMKLAVKNATDSATTHRQVTLKKYSSKMLLTNKLERFCHLNVFFRN